MKWTRLVTYSDGNLIMVFSNEEYIKRVKASTTETIHKYPDLIATSVPVDDPINHPKHYTSHPSGVECIEVVEHYPFNVGNAIKYLWRAGLKEGVSDLQDLEKARWYINREIKKRKKRASK